MKARSERTQVDADWVLRRLRDEAEADLADLYDKNNSLRPVSEWPEIWRSGLVASVESSIAQDGTRVDKVRLSDRIKRTELIGKHMDVKAFVERKEMTGKDGGAISFEDVSQMTDEQLEDRLEQLWAKARGGKDPELPTKRGS